MTDEIPPFFQMLDLLICGLSALAEVIILTTVNPSVFNIYGKILLGIVLVGLLMISYLFLYNWYQTHKNYSIVVISLSILLITIYITAFKQDTNILTAGSTLILIFITAYYAHLTGKTTAKQVNLIERERRGRYIAELARSLFSPLQISAKERLKILKSGNFTENVDNNNITSIKFLFDHNKSPISFLSGEIEIIPLEDRTSPTEIRSPIFRPVETLLNLPDIILIRHISNIFKLTRECNNIEIKLKTNVTKIYSTVEPLWDEFNKAFYSLNGSEQFEYILKREPQFVRIIFYYLIFERPLIFSRENLSRTEMIFDEMASDRICTALREFILINTENLQNWISSSPLKDAYEELKLTQNDYFEKHQRLVQEIDELLLEWKLEYYLLEQEINSPSVFFAK